MKYLSGAIDGACADILQIKYITQLVANLQAFSQRGRVHILLRIVRRHKDRVMDFTKVLKISKPLQYW